MGLQPSTSRPVPVNAFGLGVMTSSDIHFLGSLPHNPASSYTKLILDAFYTFAATLMPHLTDIKAFSGDMRVETSENGLIKL